MGKISSWVGPALSQAESQREDAAMRRLVGITGCSTAQPGEIYVLNRKGAPKFIADQEVAAAAVRLAHGPPPPPPDVEQEVVA